MFRSFLYGFGLCSLHLTVVGIILVRLQDRFAQDAVGHRIGLLSSCAARQCAKMLLQRRSERRRRRKEPLFEKTVYELGSRRARVLTGRFATLAIGVEYLVYRALVSGEGHGECLQLALRIERLAVFVDEIGLQPPDHDLRELLVVRQNVS